MQRLGIGSTYSPLTRARALGTASVFWFSVKAWPGPDQTKWVRRDGDFAVWLNETKCATLGMGSTDEPGRRGPVWALRS